MKTSRNTEQEYDPGRAVQGRSRRFVRYAAILTAGALLAVACVGLGPQERGDVAVVTAPALNPATVARASAATLAAVEEADRRAFESSPIPSASLSVGTTSTGRLVDGVQLATEGEYHSVLDRLREYRTRFGTGELVHLIEYAAEHVHRHEGGSPLRVGELSKEGGGDLPWHKSHNSGRDVDLAFYYLDEAGDSVPAPRQLHCDGRGKCSGDLGLTFDVARNWRLVEALLSMETIPVQWVFVSRPLERLLLDHARRIGADPELLVRAEDILHQPSGASAHANHFHVRIMCAHDDESSGCVDTGPHWEWLSPSQSKTMTAGNDVDRSPVALERSTR